MFAQNISDDFCLGCDSLFLICPSLCVAVFCKYHLLPVSVPQGPQGEPGPPGQQGTPGTQVRTAGDTYSFTKQLCAEEF